MEWILSFAVLAFVALIFLKSAAGKTDSEKVDESSLGYRQKRTLFSEAERSFLGVLDQCIDPTQYRVFGKVRVADIVEPNPTKNRSEWQKAFNAISAKHFDYVICSTDTLQPVCVIELDDKSHSQKKRQKRDQLIDGICKEAGLSLLRFPAQRTYNPKVIRAVVEGRFGTRPAAPDEARSADLSDRSATRTAAQEKERFAASTAAPTSGENVALQLLGQDKNKSLSESEGLKVDEVQVVEIGGAVR